LVDGVMRPTLKIERFVVASTPVSVERRVAFHVEHAGLV